MVHVGRAVVGDSSSSARMLRLPVNLQKTKKYKIKKIKKKNKKLVSSLATNQKEKQNPAILLFLNSLLMISSLFLSSCLGQGKK